jgi:hypothetical protein
MQKVQLISSRVIPGWFKRNHRSSGPGRVHEVQRGAKQTREGLRQGDPFGKSPN